MIFFVLSGVIYCLLRNIITYSLDSWTEQFEQFRCFKWMVLKNVLRWEDVEESLVFLLSKGVKLNDSKCFDQFCNLKSFVSEQLQQSNDFSNLQTHKKWIKFFSGHENREFYNELLIICQFFFAIPGQNATVERVFSLMGAQ